jgi:hypothetical protein
MYTGGVGTYGVPGTNPYTTSVVNTLTDVTSDPQWSTVVGHNRVALTNVRSHYAAQSFDTQISTIVDIKPKKIKISNNIDSNQHPLTLLVLTSRNVSVRSYGTTTSSRIFDYALSMTEGGVFKCEITNMNTFSSVVNALNYAIFQGREHIISGCISAVYYGTYQSVNVTFSGVVIAAYQVAQEGSGLRIGGLCAGLNSVMSSARGVNITARMFGCYYILHDSHTVNVGGHFVGCQQSAIFQGTNINITGKLYSMYAFHRYDLRGRGAHTIVRRGAVVPIPSNFYDRNSNIVAQISECAAKNGLYYESYNNIPGSVIANLAFGDIIKNTSVLRTGGGPYTLECVPLSLCSSSHSFPLFTWREEDVAAISQRRSVFIRGEGWTVFPTAAQLFIEAEYASTPQTTTIVTTAVLTDNTTWVEFVLPDFTPAIDSYVTYKAHLETYEAGCKIYVDCKLCGSTTKVIFRDGESALESMVVELSNVIEAAGGRFRVPPVDKVEKDYPYGVVA